MHKSKGIAKYLIYIILSILAIVWVIPLAFTIFNSFKRKTEYRLGNFWDFPKQNMLVENFVEMLQKTNISINMINSLIYALCGSIAAVIIALLAAYAITHLNIKKRMFWFLFIYSGTIFPFQIYLIPVFTGYRKTGLYNTMLGMILFYTAICIPFCMFVMRNFFMGISREIFESAKIDGGSDMQILARILVPMSIAPISVVLLTQFTWVWNDLMFGLTFIKSPNVRNVMASISQIDSGNLPVFLLACIIVSVPTILAFGFLQKNFEQGFVYSSK